MEAMPIIQPVYVYKNVRIIHMEILQQDIVYDIVLRDGMLLQLQIYV